MKGKLNRYKLFQKAADALNSDNLSDLYLKKQYLLDGVDSNVLDFLFFREDADEIRKMFQNSAILIKGMENLSNGQKNNNLFRSLLGDNLKNVERDGFISNLKENMENLFKDDKKNFNYLFAHLLKAIASYQNEIINHHLNLLSIDDCVRLQNDRQQVFLSYAYMDRGLSLALFYYFLQKSGFLYIDWMWRGSVGNGVLLKQDLNQALCYSNQFLFLRTPNSELKVRGGGNSIRQWCAWEIGNYYVQHCCHGNKHYPCKKFFTNFSGDEGGNFVSSSNPILSTFLPMKDVVNGVII